MDKIKPTRGIYGVVKDMKDVKYRWSFVWEEERICELRDSLLKDYPRGSFLVWEPNSGFTIRTRKFAQDYKIGDKLISEERTLESLPYLVLCYMFDSRSELWL